MPGLIPLLQRRWFRCWPSAWRKAKNLRRSWCYLLCAVETDETITGEQYRTQLMRLSRALRKKRPQYEQRHKKWFYSMKMFSLTLPNPLKPTWKRSNVIFTCRIPQILRRPIITRSVRWQFRSYENIEKWLDSWMASKDERFYRNGIQALSEGWAKL